MRWLTIGCSMALEEEQILLRCHELYKVVTNTICPTASEQAGWALVIEKTEKKRFSPLLSDSLEFAPNYLLFTLIITLPDDAEINEYDCEGEECSEIRFSTMRSFESFEASIEGLSDDGVILSQNECFHNGRAESVFTILDNKGRLATSHITAQTGWDILGGNHINQMFGEPRFSEITCTPLLSFRSHMTEADFADKFLWLAVSPSQTNYKFAGLIPWSITDSA